MSQTIDPQLMREIEEAKSEEKSSSVEASAAASAAAASAAEASATSIDEEQEKLIEEIKTETQKENPSENKCEKFLKKWIDEAPLIHMCKLELLLSTYRNAPDASVFLANLFSAGLPKQAEPLHRMVSGENAEREDFQVLACEYKDNLLSLIIVMLKYFLKDSEFIETPSLNPERHTIFVKRIKTIYRILTNYFIGGPNLSEKSEQDKFTSYTSKYAVLFYKETSLFGWFGRGGSIKRRSRKSKRTRKVKGLYRR